MNVSSSSPTVTGIRLSAARRGSRDFALVVVTATLGSDRYERQRRECEDDECNANTSHDLS
jgi:hypothetical protein